MWSYAVVSSFFVNNYTEISLGSSLLDGKVNTRHHTVFFATERLSCWLVMSQVLNGGQVVGVVPVQSINSRKLRIKIITSCVEVSSSSRNHGSRNPTSMLMIFHLQPQLFVRDRRAVIDTRLWERITWLQWYCDRSTTLEVCHYMMWWCVLCCVGWQDIHHAWISPRKWFRSLRATNGSAWSVRRVSSVWNHTMR